MPNPADLPLGTDPAPSPQVSAQFSCARLLRMTLGGLSITHKSTFHICSDHDVQPQTVINCDDAAVPPGSRCVELCNSVALAHEKLVHPQETGTLFPPSGSFTSEFMEVGEYISTSVSSKVRNSSRCLAGGRMVA